MHRVGGCCGSGYMYPEGRTDAQCVHINVGDWQSMLINSVAHGSNMNAHCLIGIVR